MVILQGDVQQERKKLEQALAKPLMVNMLILGGDEVRQFAENAEIRAQALPDARQVIWVFDPQILTAQAQVNYGFTTPEVVGTVLNPDGQVIKQLTLQEGQSMVNLERAFLAGQTQTQ